MMRAVLVNKDGTRREVPAVFVPGDGRNQLARLDFIEPLRVDDIEEIDVQLEISEQEARELGLYSKAPISMGYVPIRDHISP